MGGSFLNGCNKIGEVIFSQQVHFFADTGAGNFNTFKGLTCKQSDFSGIHVQSQEGAKPSL